MEKFTLKYPFDFEGEKVETLELKARLKGNDLLAAEGEMKIHGIVDPTEAERNLFMAARAVSQPVEVVKAMDLADYVSLANKLPSFL